MARFRRKEQRRRRQSARQVAASHGATNSAANGGAGGGSGAEATGPAAATRGLERQRAREARELARLGRTRVALLREAEGARATLQGAGPAAQAGASADGGGSAASEGGHGGEVLMLDQERPLPTPLLLCENAHDCNAAAEEVYAAGALGSEEAAGAASSGAGYDAGGPLEESTRARTITGPGRAPDANPSYAPRALRPLPNPR